MTGPRFAIDTNVLVYAVVHDDLIKQDRARLVLGLAAVHRGALLPLQTIGELFTTLLRKRSTTLEAAARTRAYMKTYQLVPFAVQDTDIAITEAEAGRLSYWDALLLATAARHGCAYLLTEDLQDGAVIMGVRIRNPFDGPALAPDLAELLDAG